MRRIPPSQQLAQLAEQLCREAEVEELTSELVRLGARKLIQELLKGEVTETLGRDPYERREAGADGYRNGYKWGRLDTAEASSSSCHSSSFDRLRSGWGWGAGRSTGSVVCVRPAWS